MAPSDLGECLVGALHDALRADVDPRPHSHLAVHHQALAVADLGIALGDLEHKADQLRSDGATALFLAIDGKPGGVIAIADPIKATTPSALDGLRKDGIRIVMLTGDNKITAEAVARKLGISDVEADVLPEDKSRIVKKLTS